MKRIWIGRCGCVLVVTCAAARLARGELESAEEDGARDRWRISVGASVIGPVRSDVGVRHGALRRFSGFGRGLVGHAAALRSVRTRSDAFAEGSGEAHAGVRTFDGGTWFDPVDSGTLNDPGYSWNWRLHDPTADDLSAHGKAYVERTAYVERHESALVVGGDRADCWSSDGAEWLPGIRGELAYELYRSDDGDRPEGEEARPWGVDLACAFAYYFQRNLWKTGGEAGSARVNGREDRGFWEWWNDSHDEAQYILDYYRESQFRDGLWGAGSFGGPGAELAVDTWRFQDVPTGSSSWASGHSLRYCGSGDYREFGIELLARPWWEPCRHLRLFGTVGLEVARREFDWQMDAWGTDGSSFAERGSSDGWYVMGLLGGGLSVEWEGFVLAGEALWRFGGDDLDVRGRTVRGEIESGRWGFRLSLGYTF